MSTPFSRLTTWLSISKMGILSLYLRRMKIKLGLQGIRFANSAESHFMTVTNSSPTVATTMNNASFACGLGQVAINITSTIRI